MLRMLVTYHYWYFDNYEVRRQSYYITHMLLVSYHNSQITLSIRRLSHMLEARHPLWYNLIKSRMPTYIKTRLYLKQLWAWVVFRLQLSNTCLNIDVRINHGTMTPRVANWLPKFVGINLFSLGVSNGHKV